MTADHIGVCHVCRHAFKFDPATVKTVPIDPMIGRSPRFGGNPDRCVRKPVCPKCVKLADEMGPQVLKLIDDLGV